MGRTPKGARYLGRQSWPYGFLSPREGRLQMSELEIGWARGRGRGKGRCVHMYNAHWAGTRLTVDTFDMSGQSMCYKQR